MDARQRLNQQLRRVGVTPSKRRGQNFLIDSHALDQIVRFADVQHDEPVLEIGPGLGALTEVLLERTSRMLAAEIEPAFAEDLRSRFPSLSVVVGDIRTLNAEELAARLGVPRFAIVSNVPYSISTDITLWVLANRKFISRASLLLQREFARRLAATPGGREYGSLTVLRTLYAEASLGPEVSGDAFVPSTEVESQVICIRPREHPLVENVDPLFMERVVRTAFGQRRKTLLNSLSRFPGLESKDQLLEILGKVGIDPKRRAETLSVVEYGSLTAALATSLATALARTSPTALPPESVEP